MSQLTLALVGAFLAYLLLHAALVWGFLRGLRSPIPNGAKP